ncbi:MAG: hypothetical protein FD144_789 [Rhodospirillaceae bacterium]|nr:MAG: hypothetical protein FD144_789 [Rhodospirillaceae bacterium]
MMMSKHYILVVIGICLAACSHRARPVDPNSDVVFVPLGEEPRSDRHPERVATGMSREQVEAIMGPSVETCWIYTAGNASQRICFRRDKVTVIARTEHVPGTDRAFVDATFTTDASNSEPVPAGQLAIGTSREQVRRLLGSPQTTREQYDVGSGYRATFENGRLTELQRIPVPPPIAISAGSRSAGP